MAERQPRVFDVQHGQLVVTTHAVPDLLAGIYRPDHDTRAALVALSDRVSEQARRGA